MCLEIGPQNLWIHKVYLMHSVHFTSHLMLTWKQPFSLFCIPELALKPNLDADPPKYNMLHISGFKFANLISDPSNETCFQLLSFLDAYWSLRYKDTFLFLSKLTHS